ncbi:hypothetical protein CDAR_513911 [Caerostris darwini]|uniref:Uncharacterized protein n=1 Tax=Caerostris darwini TaxID=1538125 RepID=A0AAV4PUA9_9ARAC|nr:hypothetical protein CDAR_513911 [Caerostris darwini]
MLQKYEADIDAISQNKVSPLYEACYQGSIACAELLLNMGADVHTSKNWRTSLHKACMQDKWNVQRILLTYGADKRF